MNAVSLSIRNLPGELVGDSCSKRPAPVFASSSANIPGERAREREVQLQMDVLARASVSVAFEAARRVNATLALADQTEKKMKAEAAETEKKMKAELEKQHAEFEGRLAAAQAIAGQATAHLDAVQSELAVIHDDLALAKAEATGSKVCRRPPLSPPATRDRCFQTMLTRTLLFRGGVSAG